MSSLGEWLSAFRDLHERARRGALSPKETGEYRAGREELARALLAAQRLTLKPGEVPRQALRVARALQVDLDVPGGSQRAVTIDLGTGGFSCLLSRSPVLGHEIAYSLRIPAAEPLAGKARVVDVRALPGNVRAAFQFLALPPADLDRLELFVFDTVLAQLVA